MHVGCLGHLCFNRVESDDEFINKVLKETTKDGHEYLPKSFIEKPNVFFAKKRSYSVY